MNTIAKPPLRELDPNCIYTVSLNSGYLDIRTSEDPDYPGVEIEFIPDKEHSENVNFKITIEQPYTELKPAGIDLDVTDSEVTTSYYHNTFEPKN